MSCEAVCSPVALFLVGAERSGTTVLRLMLDHHPVISWVNEFEYAVDRIRPDGSWPALPEYYEWVETHRVFQASGFGIDRSLDYPDLVRSFLAQRRARANKPIVGATVHRNFDRLLHIWPEARFIHIFRDARDVARSNVRIGWAGNVYMGVERWMQAEKLWEALRDRIGSERFIEIKQEDLIRAPTRVLTRICQFLDVAYDEKMLEYPANTTYEAPDPQLVEQWRRKASEEEILLVESRIAGMLVARGYELSGLTPFTVTAEMERRLRRQDRAARARFRLKRYGLKLWIADVLSRRVGPRAWQKVIRLKLNEIDRKHLK